jgi:hypothetical protein
LLRIPGLGVRNVDRILDARRFTRSRLSDLVLLRLSMKKIMPFIIAADHRPRLALLESTQSPPTLPPRPPPARTQLQRPASDDAADAAMALNGQI